MSASTKPRCLGCGDRHIVHGGPCKAKGPVKSVLIPAKDGGIIRVCGYRPPCPCPWRTCKCGTPLAVAVELPAGTILAPVEGQVMLVSVRRGSAGDWGGRLAVWKLANGMLGCRDLAGGEEPGEGEYRGCEHDETKCGYDLQLVRAS